jgi:hypothetical protein
MWRNTWHVSGETALICGAAYMNTWCSVHISIIISFHNESLHNYAYKCLKKLESCSRNMFVNIIMNAIILETIVEVLISWTLKIKRWVLYHMIRFVTLRWPPSPLIDCIKWWVPKGMQSNLRSLWCVGQQFKLYSILVGLKLYGHLYYSCI